VPVTVTPLLILALWMGGMAGGAALVAWWGLGGVGFPRVVATAIVGFGAITVLAGGGPMSVFGVVTAAAAGVVASRNRPTTALFGVSALAFAAVGVGVSPPVWAVSGIVFLGGVTTEMLLGHWFLVDPRLPRRPLRVLDAVGAVGLLLDVLVAAAYGAFGSDPTFVAAYAALVVFTGVLLVGVWFSLREPAYSGVMAATGLSYLAVLTSLGVVALGRVLLSGVSGG